VDQQSGEKTLVEVIQGEQTDEEEVVGLRYLEGVMAFACCGNLSLLKK
jgi:hypothetical protein